jgi:hypothetical protein
LLAGVSVVIPEAQESSEQGDAALWLAAGRLGEDSGRDPADAAGRADDYLAAAAAAAVSLGDVLSAAQNCLSSIHRAGPSTDGAAA